MLSTRPDRGSDILYTLFTVITYFRVTNNLGFANAHNWGMGINSYDTVSVNAMFIEDFF